MKDSTPRGPIKGTWGNEHTAIRPVSGGQLWTNTEAFVIAVERLKSADQQDGGYSQRLHSLGAWMSLRLLRASWSTGVVTDGNDVAISQWLGVSRTTWLGWRSTLEHVNLLGIGPSGCNIAHWNELEGRQEDGTHLSGGHAVTSRQAATHALESLMDAANQPGGGGVTRGWAAWGAWWVLVLAHMTTGGRLASSDSEAARALGLERRSWQRLAEVLKTAGLIRREGTAWHVDGDPELHNRRPAKTRSKRSKPPVIHSPDRPEPVAETPAPNLDTVPAPNLDTVHSDALITCAYTRADEESKPSPTPHETPEPQPRARREGLDLSPVVVELIERLSDAMPTHADEIRTSSGLGQSLKKLVSVAPLPSLADLAHELSRDVERTYSPVGVVVFRARALSREHEDSAATSAVLDEASASIQPDEAHTRAEIRHRLDEDTKARRHRDLAHEIGFGLDDNEFAALARTVGPHQSKEVAARRMLAWAEAARSAFGAAYAAEAVGSALYESWAPDGELTVFDGPTPDGERQVIARLEALRLAA